MKEISVFREKLHEHLQWNRERLLFVSMFLIALMRVKTVNLVEIA
ncbi:MAG TPA: IS4 family transposase, partial [Pseudanabaena sp.]|nr:IS4 family transposase [Pseudanabaena sp.]